MQIDWGWGVSLCTHTSPMGGRGRLNSDTLPMSHSLSFLHTLINTHMLMDKRMGVGQSPQPVSHSVGSQQQWHQPELTLLSLSLSLPASPFTLKNFILWCFLFWDVVWNFFFLLFLSSPSLHHGLWIWAYLSQCRMFSGSRNVDSGPPIRLVRAGRTSGVKQVSSWDWHPWNHEPKSR